MALVPVYTALSIAGPAAAGVIVTDDPALSRDRNGDRGGGSLVLGGNLSLSDGTLSNFRTIGGAGSGGGAGLGGAIFINSGASATLSDVSFAGNTAVGGLGGTTSLTGGVLNGMMVSTGDGAGGAGGRTFEDNAVLMGDGNGNGVAGTVGGNGGAASGFGGRGGAGGNGSDGWGTNPIQIARVAAASVEVAAAAIDVAAAIAEVPPNPVQATAAAALADESAALDKWNAANNRGDLGDGGKGGAGGFGFGGGSGGATVALGDKTLTLSDARGVFAGTIGGTGGLAVAGGTATLTGMHGFTGPAVIGAGATLAPSGAGSLAAASGVMADGTFDVSGVAGAPRVAGLSGTGAVALGDRTLTFTAARDGFAGTIGGAGGVSVVGGTQTLTGVNTYTGGTSVTGATLAVNGDAALGAVSGGVSLTDATLRATAGLDSARPVRFTGAATVDTGGQTVRLSGALSGSGGLIADGGGTLTLAGVNGYTGGTVIVGGTTVQTASDAALGDPSAAVVIERGRLVALDSFASARAIVVNEGGVLDSNGYTLSLTGPIVMHNALADTLLFSGSARVIGPLIVDERGLTVPANAMLRGTGTVSTPTTIAGTLAPGNSPGTLLFTAPLTLQPGAVLQLDVDGTGTGTGNHSRVLVQGATFTAGGVLRSLLRGITGDATNAYTPPVGQSFRVVETTGGVLGGFQGLEQPVGLLPGSRFDALYTSDAIVLYATPASYADLSPFGRRLTRNQTSTGAALDALRGPAGVRNDPAATPALGTLFAQTPDALPGVLDGLSATVYGDALLAGLERGRLFGGAVSEQLAARRGGDRSLGLRPHILDLGRPAWGTACGWAKTGARRTAPAPTDWPRTRTCGSGRGGWPASAWPWATARGAPRRATPPPPRTPTWRTSRLMATGRARDSTRTRKPGSATRTWTCGGA